MAKKITSRKIVLAICSVLCFQSCQTLDGTYRAHGPRMWGGKIHFSKKNQFKYEYSHCTGSDLGKGIFSTSNDTLILDFQNYDDTLASTISTQFLENNLITDSVVLKIEGFDLRENEPLSEQLLIYDSTGTHLFKSISIISGKADFFVSKSWFPIKIEIDDYFLNNFTNIIWAPKSQLIKMNIYPRHWGKYLPEAKKEIYFFEKKGRILNLWHSRYPKNGGRYTYKKWTKLSWYLQRKKWKYQRWKESH